MTALLHETAGETRLRLDKWLWHARFYKTRRLATGACASGRIRVNGIVVAKAHHALRAGDVVTFALGTRICIVRVLGLGARRGPAAEARLLYEDLAPPPPLPSAEVAAGQAAAEARPSGSGRPTKADRRALDHLRSQG